MVGPEARPITLFYGLSQAGRAIVATHLEDTDCQGHGLTCPSDGVPLPQRRIKRHKRSSGGDLFSAVVAALKSDDFSGSLTLAEAWASLPDLWIMSLGSETVPTAIPVDPQLPGGMTISNEVPAALLFHREVEPGTEIEASVLAELLGRYPTATGWEIKADRARVQSWEGGARVRVLWRAEASSFGDRQERLDEVAPAYRYSDQFWLRPALDGANLNPLLAWWCVLYALSSVARYEPRSWRSWLDVDSSQDAASLEHGLEVALGALPHLVLEALTGERILLPPLS